MNRMFQKLPHSTNKKKMYADIVDLESLSLTPANKLVTVCGYVRKVLITFNF